MNLKVFETTVEDTLTKNVEYTLVINIYYVLTKYLKSRRDSTVQEYDVL